MNSYDPHINLISVENLETSPGIQKKDIGSVSSPKWLNKDDEFSFD